jgi:hypothetical protein
MNDEWLQATLNQGMQKVECKIQELGSKPPSGYPEANLRLSGGQPVGTLKPPPGHPQATRRLPGGYPEAPERVWCRAGTGGCRAALKW